MQFAKQETSLLQIKEVTRSEYSWDFKIPPKTRINRNMTELKDGGGFIFNNLKFTHGILANVPHQLNFELFKNQVNVYVLLPPKDRKRYDIRRSGRLELFCENELRCVKDLRFTCEDKSLEMTPHFQFSSRWTNNDSTWDDNIDLMRVVFYVDCQEVGEVISHPCEDITRKLKLNIPPLELDASNLYLSKELSDVTFLCGGKEFPAHRFLLACKSPVFRQMFHHDMKENTEGKIVIEDMNPIALKELLRFLYCGKTESIKEFSTDLFIAAEKYDLAVLKNQCELILYQDVSAENALQMYDLAETYNGKVLKEKARAVMSKNKSKMVPDADTFLAFAKRYPDLLFDLYTL